MITRTISITSSKPIEHPEIKLLAVVPQSMIEQPYVYEYEARAELKSINDATGFINSIFAGSVKKARIEKAGKSGKRREILCAYGYAQAVL